MKNMYFNPRLALIIFGLILFSCNSSKKAVLHENEIESYFIIGTGGGFTGEYTQYKIFESGLIEIYAFENKTYHQYKIVNKKQVSDFFNEIDKLDLIDIEYSIPGNISDYIDVLSNDQTINHIVWANGTNDFNPEIIKFHENVMRFIKDLEKK